jgi:glutathione S-transferase/predicted heme/steroid binding protein|eukprot:g53.t1
MASLASNKTKPTITYFDFSAAPGEKLRLCCVIGDIPFEDNRVKPGPQWSELKPLTPHGTLPIMVKEDDTVVTQSEAILKYLGRRATPPLYPLDDIEKQLKIDTVMGILDDLDKAWAPPLYISMKPYKYGYDKLASSTDAGKARIKMLREQFLRDDLKRIVGHLTKELKKSGGPFICGDKPTIADCRLLPTLRNFQRGHVDHVPVTCLDSYTEMSEYIKFMMSLPAVKAWYQKGSTSTKEAAEGASFTTEELLQYRGEENGKPAYLCAKGVVFDVSANEMYKAGNSYHLFTGHDASRSLAKMSLDPSDLNGATDDLNENQLSTLDDWFKKFTEKYPRVGVLKN